MFALVLLSTRHARELNMTRTPVAVTDLLDDNDSKVELATFHLTNGHAPDTPDIVFFPLVHGIPPTYCAHNMPY